VNFYGKEGRQNTYRDKKKDGIGAPKASLGPINEK